MKAISGEIYSSTPASVSEAAAFLSKFISSETGASQAVNAYLRRANSSFDDLVRLHSKNDRKRQKQRNVESETLKFPTRSVKVNQEPSQTELINAPLVADTRSGHEESKGRMGIVLEEGQSNLEEETENRSNKDKNKKKKKKEKEKDGANFGNVAVDSDGKRRKGEVKREESNLEESATKKHKNKKRDKSSDDYYEGNKGELVEKHSGEELEIKDCEKEESDHSRLGIVEDQKKKRNKKRKKTREVEEEASKDGPMEDRKSKKKRSVDVGN